MEQNDGPSTPIKRYPTTLSRVVTAGSIPKRQRGSSKHYESLEDLLTAAGYKETRIFTPERDRVRDVVAEGPTDTNSESESSTSNTKRIGNIVANFLSSWVPGASVSLGRAQGAQLARRGARGSPGFHSTVAPALDMIPQSPPEYRIQSRRKINPSDRRGIVHPQLIPGVRSKLPLDFMVPTHQSVGDMAQRALTPVHNTRVSERLHSHLRNTASSPNLKNPPLRDSVSRDGLYSHLEAQARRGRRLPNNSNRSNSYLSPSSAHHSRARDSQIVKPKISRRKSFVSAPTPLSPVLNSRDVLCRSRPNSRSASRVRRSSNDQDVPPVPPLLSPEIVDSSLNEWISRQAPQDGQSPSHSLTVDVHAVESDSDDEEADGIGNVLHKILSSRIHGSVSSLSNPSTDESALSQECPGFMQVPHAPVFLRRQQSIQSLRAHLKHRPHSGTMSKMTSNSQKSQQTTGTLIDERDSWLDCPEWSSSRPPMNKAQSSSKRGVIPWFGGERAYLDGFPSRVEPDWDD